MRSGRSSGRLWSRVLARVVLPTAAALSCGTEGVVGPPHDVASLEIVGDTLIPLGDGRDFHVLARSGEGATIGAPPLSWSTGDSYVATVSTRGRVVGLAPGFTTVVVRSGSLADSLVVRVHEIDATPGTVRGWIRTHEGRTPIAWTGGVDVLDVMGGDSGDRSRLLINNGGEPGVRDSVLRLDWSGPPGLGRAAVVPHPAAGGTEEGVVAIFVHETEDFDLRLYYSVAVGSLHWSRLTYPERPGLLPGNARGLVELRLAGYDVPGVGDPTPTGDTIEVYLEGDAWLQHLLRPRVHASLDGGPATGTTSSTFGQTSLGSTRLEAWWDIDVDERPGQPWAYEAQLALIIGDPSAGDFSLRAIDMSEYADRSKWPDRFAVVHYRDDPRVALSRGGMTTLSRLLLPTPDYYGELEGTLMADLELWTTDGQRTGVTVSSTATFAIPITPIGAAPPASSRGSRIGGMPFPER